MLEDIEELRNAFREGNDNVDGDGVNQSNNDDNASTVLSGAMRPSSFQQVLAQFLPPRHKVDQLVGTYFKMKSVAAPFIHTRQFSRLYRLFWDNPSAASPLWASILFSILEIASETLSTASRTVLYERGELDSDIAILMGTLMRLGTVMGYHRDADGYQQKISMFEGEIRRRTWSICMQLDMLISFQFGLPSNTQYPTWDTRPPTNLFDSDFDEGTLRLPPARPMIEPTELSLYIAKHKMMSVFEKVIRHTLSTDQPSDEMKAIDQEIRSTFDALSARFKPQSMADSVVDSPTVKITRLFCSLSFRMKYIKEKAVLVLALIAHFVNTPIEPSQLSVPSNRRGVSAAVNDLGAREASFVGLRGRGDKETVTVTVTPDCSPAETPVVNESSTPVVVVPGTQSETSTISIPAGGATITPGVSSVSVPSKAKESTAVTPVPETPASGSPTTTPSPVVPASVNTSSVAIPVGSGPIISSGTTTAVSTKTSTSSKTTSIETTSTEETASATPTPASSSPTPATGAAVDNFAGVYVTLAVALFGTVALLI
ncbi:hypothetical protein G7Y79_00016g041010 [Physcia stellaris]|nr:hypothetical protein G7Y79_00016g041010 [Physcia stellaris]